MSHPGIIPLSEARDLLILDCESRRLAPATRHYYAKKTGYFIRWLADENIHHVHEVTPIHIRRYLASIEERGLTSRYQHNLARAIRAFFNYLVRDELLEKSPFDRVKMPKMEKKIPETFTQEEIQRVIQACNTQRDKAMCFFLLDTGVRSTELFNMNVGDVDLETGVVIVHKGKGQKERPTFIGAGTRKQLRYYFMERGKMRADEPLFLSLMGKRRMTQEGLVQLFGRLQKASGVKHCKAHTFRRTFAITCLRNGMNVYVLAKLMGHADITVLRHYLALVEDDLKDAHERYGAVDHFDFTFSDERRIRATDARRGGEPKSTRGRKPKGIDNVTGPAEGYYKGNRPEEYEIVKPRKSADGGRKRR